MTRDEIIAAMHDPKKAPRPGMYWSRKLKRWLDRDTRTAAEKKRDREAKRERVRIEKIWAPIASRIPEGWSRSIDCGLGWKDLIFELVENIDFVFSWFTGKQEDYWHPVQVKQKFGGLRFYIRSKPQPPRGKAYKAFKTALERTWKVVEVLVSQAEHTSVFTCEDCGGRGERRSVNGWVGTVCQLHYDTWIKRRINDDKQARLDRAYRKKLELSMIDDIERKLRKEKERAK